VRGALALTIQAAPSVPVDGDVWITSAGLFAHVAGVIVALSAAISSIRYGAVSLTTGGTVTKLNSGSASKNVGAMTNNGAGLITVTNAGTYRIFASVSIDPTASTHPVDVSIFIGQNGTGTTWKIGEAEDNTTAPTTKFTIAGEILVDLNAGDTIEIDYQIPGSPAPTASAICGQLTVERKA
jgi:hypothetical protein